MNLDPVSKIKTEIPDELWEKEFSASAVEATCIAFGESEFVIALDSGLPLDEIFISNYFCDDCGLLTVKKDA